MVVLWEKLLRFETTIQNSPKNNQAAKSFINSTFSILKSYLTFFNFILAS